MSDDDLEPTCETCGTDDVRFRRTPESTFGYWCSECEAYSRPPSERAAADRSAALVAAARSSRRTTSKARDLALEAALLEEMARLGGSATTHDLRPIRNDVSPDVSDEGLSFALIRMRDEDGTIDSPFGHAGTAGAEPARRSWLQRNRPDQQSSSNQVWRLQPTVRRELLLAARDSSPPAVDALLARKFTAKLRENYEVVVPAACGYRANRMIAMLGEREGAEVVRHLMETHWREPSDGFAAIVSAGRPDLTFEAIALESEWSLMFTALELAWCEDRIAGRR